MVLRSIPDRNNLSPYLDSWLINTALVNEVGSLVSVVMS